MRPDNESIQALIVRLPASGVDRKIVGRSPAQIQEVIAGMMMACCNAIKPRSASTLIGVVMTDEVALLRARRRRMSGKFSVGQGTSLTPGRVILAEINCSGVGGKQR